MTAEALTECLDSPSPAPTPVFSRQNREESEAYPRVVAVLNSRLRVIHGKCGLQWILQVRKSPSRFESIAFCGTKQGLILRIREHLQPRDAKQILPLEEIAAAWAAIEALPEHFPKQAPQRMAGA